MTRFEVRTGDCLAVMRTLDDSSVDSIVTDPPYELGFMGKSWDASGVAFRVEVWREALRVLKPGGHLLAFSGSRTYHRMVVAIEDAGFEIRDQIMWLYGSGFPKSHDVSKAIDKRGGSVASFAEFRDAVKHAMRKNGVTRQELQSALGNFMLSHYLTEGSQPAVPVLRDYRIIRDTVRLGNRFDELFKDEAEREIIGKHETDMGGLGGERLGQKGGDITAPATPEAARWQGWGTALKPAHEPIVVARKPLIGTVAANVMAHGTGALNIDGCRVETDETLGRAKSGWGNAAVGATDYGNFNSIGITVEGGRWPANLIHDGSEEVVGMFPETGPSKATQRNNAEFKSYSKGKEYAHVTFGHDDAGGSAARFFYSAKASKRDRDEGLDKFPYKKAAAMQGNLIDGQRLSGNGSPIATPVRANIHPTVKPTDLMRYLCRLVTPPGGLVLDPFTGSGSTGKGAVLEGFRFLGIELSPEYTEIARARIRHAVGHVAPEPVTEAQVPDALPGQLRLFA